MKKIRFIFSCLLAACLFSGIFTTGSLAAEKVNFAEKAKVEACGYYIDDESPDKAVDGYSSTKWCCTETHKDLKNEDYVHWLIIDLGESKTVNKFMLKNASAGGVDRYYTTSNLQEGKIQYSADKETWTDIVSVENPDRVETLRYFVEPTEMRYVRLLCSVVAVEDSNVRLPEIAVMYSEEDPNNPDPEPEEADDDRNVAPGETYEGPVESEEMPPEESKEESSKPKSSEVAPSVNSDETEESSAPVLLILIITGSVVVAGGIAAVIVINKKGRK